MRRIQALALLLIVCAALGAAKEAPFSLPRSAPEAQGISSADLLGFVDEAEQKLNALHSFMLVRHGQVVAEGWWGPYAADEPHMMYLAQQELHVHGRRPGGRRRQAEGRRSGAGFLSRRSASRAQRESESHARPRSADDVDRAP